MKILCPVLVLLFLFVGCASTIPREYYSRIDRAASYPVVISNIDKHIGTTVLWGGYVHETRNTPEGTYVEVIESPLNSMERPKTLDQTRGRFLILYPGYAESVRYAPGKAITVVGQIRGEKKLPLGEIGYAYPVILRQYDRLWKTRERPNVHLGIGMGTVFSH